MLDFFRYYPLEVPDFFSEIHDFVEAADTEKWFQQKHYPDHFSPEFIEKFKPWFENLIGANISGPTSGFVNITKFNGLHNETPWHNEGGFANGLKDSRTGETQVKMEREFVCFFWLAGKRGQGGALRFINDHDGTMGIAELDPPGFMLATKDTIHSVEHYSSQQFRVNFTVDFSVDQ